jgi:hypothetical protein
MKFYKIALILTLIIGSNHSLQAENTQSRHSEPLSFINDPVYFYVIGDSIPYYSNPSDKSESLGYLNWGDSILCNHVFSKNDGTIELKQAHTADIKHWYPWMNIKLNGADSVWISHFDVTYKFELDVSDDFCIGYSHHSDEAGNPFVLTHFLTAVGDDLKK